MSKHPQLANERSRLKATQHIRSNLQSVGVLSFPKKKNLSKIGKTLHISRLTPMCLI
jgi:hypothetical protein